MRGSKAKRLREKAYLTSVTGLASVNRPKSAPGQVTGSDMRWIYRQMKKGNV